MSDNPDENHYVRILQAHEEELVSTLRETDLLELSKELAKCEVLSQEEVDNFGSLDHDCVDVGLKSRYLIQQLMKAAAAENRVWDRLLGVLHSLGDDIKEMFQPKKTVNCQGDHESLMEEDIATLMGILTDIADKWKEVGAALELPSAVLEEYGKSGLSSPELLHKVLLEWITEQHKATLSASLQDLKCALEGKIVGFSEMAEKLEEKLLTIERDNQTQHEDKLEIIMQSSNAEISEGKSALLEVQTATATSSLSFQWQKNGQPLANSQVYSAVASPVLFIRASEVMEGEYVCLVKRGEEEVCSDKIALTVTRSSQDKHLVKLYSKLDDMKENYWPLLNDCKFNNLVIAENIEEKSSKSLQKIDYKETFGYIDSGTLVLVKGCSGGGKTALAYKLASDWSKGDVLNKMKMVFLITAGMLNSHKTIKQLSDILRLFYPDPTQNVLLGEIEKTLGHGVCFIVDDLDSCYLEEESNTVITHLMQRTYLPEAAVIVTSRTIDAAAFANKGKHMKQVELSKLTDEQIFQSIDDFPFLSPSDACDAVDPFKLKDYIHAHSTALDLCSLPAHVAMACFIHQHKDEYNLTLLSNLYKNFTQTVSQDSKGMDHIRKMCKIAFETTLKNSYVISQSDIEIPLSEFSYSGGPLIGLLRADHMSRLLGLEDTCTFLHKALQEFLAAFHVAELQLKNQEDLIRQHASKEHLQGMWKFFCGLTHLRGISAPCIGMVLPKTGLFEIHSAYESQQQVICNVVIQAGEAGLVELSEHTLTTYDLNALCYVVATASKQVTSICMNNCGLGDGQVREMVSQIQNDKLKLVEKLSLASNNIGSLGATALAQGLKHPRGLEELLGDENTAALSSEINHLNLQELDLSNNNIGSDGAITFFYELKKSLLNLQVLNLSRNNIGSGGAGAIIKDLLELKSLKSLNLSQNNIDSVSALAVVRGFTRARHSLHHLHLEGNAIDGDNQDLKAVLSECRSHLAVHLSASVILQSVFHSQQTCCNMS